GRRHLRHAEQGIRGGLAQEFGVDGDKGLLCHPPAGVGQFGGCRDRLERPQRDGGNGLRNHWRFLFLMSVRRRAGGSPSIVLYPLTCRGFWGLRVTPTGWAWRGRALR